MKCHTSLTVTLLVAATALVLLAGPASAQQARQNALNGDWNVKTEFNGRTMESILSLARDQDGNLTGQWISFMGVSALKDLKFEEGKLSFTRVMQTRDGQSSTSTFKGTIADGKLSGTVSSERGDSTLTGTRAPRMPRGAGLWDLKTKRGDQESTATLALTADKEGKLTGQWKSERGELALSDVQFAQNKLTFKAKSTNPDRAFEATFEGTIQRNALTGTLKSERGETTVEGTRKGTALVGTWNLEVVSDRGTRTQRLGGLPRPDRPVRGPADQEDQSPGRCGRFPDDDAVRRPVLRDELQGQAGGQEPGRGVDDLPRQPEGDGHQGSQHRRPPGQ